MKIKGNNKQESLSGIKKRMTQINLDEAAGIHNIRHLYGHNKLADSYVEELRHDNNRERYKLESERQIILENRRNGLLSKLVWSVLAPLLVSVSAAYFISSYNLVYQSNSKINNSQNDLMIERIQGEVNINNRAFEFLKDIYYYEQEETNLWNTFMIYQDTFCPVRNSPDNSYQITKKELNKIKEKYKNHLTDSNIYEVLEIKESRLRSIETTCSKYY